MFNHVDLNLEPLKRETIDGVRNYSIPDEDVLIKLVSISSVNLPTILLSSQSLKLAYSIILAPQLSRFDQ